MKLPIFLLLFVGSGAQAKVTESWVCKDAYSEFWTTIVTAEVLESRSSGLIKVAGITYDAHFQVKGFNRRWDFGLVEDGSYDYAFVIKPNGDGSYYDFSSTNTGKTINPSQLLTCQQSKLNRQSGT